MKALWIGCLLLVLLPLSQAQAQAPNKQDLLRTGTPYWLYLVRKRW